MSKYVEILAVYDLFDDSEISTERLLQMVADTCDCEVDEVCEALENKTMESEE